MGKSNRIGLTDIQHVVDTNDKQRFSMVQENDGWYVRANQGHSMKCVNTEELLTKITWNDLGKFPVVCHGTYSRHWDSIRQQGLNRMTRNHIHFVPSDSFGGKNVISGMRKSCELLIYINLRAALKDGVPFYVSANNVLLSPGINGVLPPRYFLKVTQFQNGRSGKIVWQPPHDKGNENGGNQGGAMSIRGRGNPRGRGNVRGRGYGRGRGNVRGRGVQAHR